jgi:uncharacterized surface anchored protein
MRGVDYVSAAIAIAGAVACGGSSAPTNPAPTLVTLSGTVRDRASNSLLTGATVTIADGANSGRSATTDALGAFSLKQLQAGTASLTTSATGYTTKTQPVTFTTDTTVDVQLERAPAAILEPFGSLAVSAVGGGNFALAGALKNTGNACATNIGGSVTVTATNGTAFRTFPLTIASPTTLRPGDTLTYSICCVNQSEASLIGPTPGYSAQLSFVSTACP